MLVVRSKNDKRLDDADLAAGLDSQPSINVHWGGMGMARDVNSWSGGCQVINGAVYINANNDLIDCLLSIQRGDAVPGDRPRRRQYTRRLQRSTGSRDGAGERRARHL